MYAYYHQSTVKYHILHPDGVDPFPLKATDILPHGCINIRLQDGWTWLPQRPKHVHLKKKKTALENISKVKHLAAAFSISAAGEVFLPRSQKKSYSNICTFILYFNLSFSIISARNLFLMQLQLIAYTLHLQGTLQKYIIHAELCKMYAFLISHTHLCGNNSGFSSFQEHSRR